MSYFYEGREPQISLIRVSISRIRGEKDLISPVARPQRGLQFPEGTARTV